MLQPKRTKFRKMHKGRIHGQAKGGSDLTFGTFGLRPLSPSVSLRVRSKLHVVP